MGPKLLKIPKILSMKNEYNTRKSENAKDGSAVQWEAPVALGSLS